MTLAPPEVKKELLCNMTGRIFTEVDKSDATTARFVCSECKEILLEEALP